MRRGDFGELPRQIYNPFTTNILTLTRDPFGGNIIPSSLWDPIAAKLIKAYPLPTAPGLTNNNVTNPTKTQD